MLSLIFFGLDRISSSLDARIIAALICEGGISRNNYVVPRSHTNVSNSYRALSDTRAAVSTPFESLRVSFSKTTPLASMKLTIWVGMRSAIVIRSQLNTWDISILSHSITSSGVGAAI